MSIPWTGKREAILRALADSELGESLSGVARRAGTTAITASKHLERLKKEGLVVEYPKPPMRLFVLAERAGDLH